MSEHGHGLAVRAGLEHNGAESVLRIEGRDGGQKRFATFGQLRLERERQFYVQNMVQL